MSALVFTPEMLPVFLFKRDYFREFISGKLLVLWGVRIIKRPLLKRDILADKANQPAVLAKN